MVVKKDPSAFDCLNDIGVPVEVCVKKLLIEFKKTHQQVNTWKDDVVEA